MRSFCAVSSLFVASIAAVEEVDESGLLQAHLGSTLSGCDGESLGAEFDGLVSSCELMAEKDYKFAHEAPVYIPAKNAVLFSSNRLGEGKSQTIEILTIDLSTNEVTKLPEQVWKHDLVMANGGILDISPGSPNRPSKVDSVLIASQGNMENSAGIYRLNVDTHAVQQVLNTSSWEKMGFNSPNDLVIDPVSGAILFTDPVYGFAQGFRPFPQFPGSVWAYLPGSAGPMKPQGPGDHLRQLSDEFRRPNGIAFASEKGDTLLVTDSGMFPGAEFVSEYELLGGAPDGAATETDYSGPRTVYAMDVKRHSTGEISALTNRRILFTAAAGVPDGIKVDCDGRIYVGVGNGVAIYSQHGRRLGTLKTRDGCANLVLVPRRRKTEIVALCESQIFRFKINAKTCGLGA